MIIFKDENRKRLVVSVICLTFLVLCLVSSGTYAFLSWVTVEEDATTVIFDIEGSGMNANLSGGVQTVTNLVPTVCTDEVYAIKKELVLDYSNSSDDIATIKGTLSIRDLITRYGELTDNELKHFRYAVTKSDVDCSTDVIKGASGSFRTTDGTLFRDVVLNESIASNTSGSEKYYLWVWLDEDYVYVNYDDEVSDPTQDVSFTLVWDGSMLSEKDANVVVNEPVVDEGMIPVTIANDGTVTTISENDDNWYDYGLQEWANVVLVDSDSRSTYKNSSGVVVNQDDILAYYVWIPRYKYKIWDVTGTSSPQSIDIKFELDTDDAVFGTTVGSWRTHPAFMWNGSPVSGIWISKFEVSAEKSSACYTNMTNNNCNNSRHMPRVLPNVNSLIYINPSNLFQASLKFSGGILSNGNVIFLGSTVYGLTGNIDSHATKNNEWGAVSYLSHSKYGINEEIRINNYYNDGKFMTGCGAIRADAEVASECQIAYGSSYNYPQSTTGNITGVFDMSGGARDYVMGNYNDTLASSGFSSMPSFKYYDKYTSDNMLTACNGGICFGHALSETKGWYGDHFGFVNSEYPWFVRGGLAEHGVTAGAFYANPVMGAAGNFASFRSTLIYSENTAPQTYNIEYKLGNGTDTAGYTTIGTQTCIYGEDCVLTKFTDMGATFPHSSGGTYDYYWNFAGWNELEDGEVATVSNDDYFNVDFNDGQTVINLTEISGETISLYAIGKRAVNVYSGYPTELHYSETQYWNPISTNADFLSSITLPESIGIDTWEFIGYKGGSNAANALVDFVPSLAGTSIKPTVTTGRYISSKYKRTLTFDFASDGINPVQSLSGTQYYNTGTLSNEAVLSRVSIDMPSAETLESGKKIDSWESDLNGNIHYPGDKVSWKPSVTNTDTTITFIPTLSDTKVYIRYSTNGGTITSQTTNSSGTTYNWSSDSNTSNGLIYRGDSIYQHSTTASDYVKSGVYNYNNSQYIEIKKTGYIAPDDAEWICLEGCTTPNKTFDQTIVYDDSEFCDSSNGDCTVVLGVNWEPIEYTVEFRLGNGTDTPGYTVIGTQTCTYGKDCVLTKFADWGKAFPHSSGGDYNYYWSFGGWGENDSDTSIDKKDGASVKNLSEIDGAVVPLYAIGRRKFNFYSGNDNTSPIAASDGLYQYWNPISTASSQLTAITIPAQTDISGWTFMGYKGGSDTANDDIDFAPSKVGTSVKPAYNVGRYLRSKYKRTITYKFDANGGTGTMSSISKDQIFNAGYNGTSNISNVCMGFPKLGFTKANSTFVNWKSDVSGNTHIDGAKSVCYKPTLTNTVTTVTFAAQWRLNRVYIQYSTNGGTVKSSTTYEDVNYTWTQDSDGIISRSKEGGTALNKFKYLEYGDTTIDLPNWNGSYINISKTGNKAVKDNEWKCLSGCTTSGKTFDHAETHNSSAFCNAANGDCTVVLGVNWEPIEYTVEFYLGNGTSTAGSTKIGTQTFKYGETKALTKFANFGKAFPHSSGGLGYDYWWNFYGWGTSTSDTSRDYTDGKSVSNLTDTDGGVIKLYAIGYRIMLFYSAASSTPASAAPAEQIYSENQYWNPYSTSNSYLTAVTIPNQTDINGWTFMGYRGGYHVADGVVDVAASKVGTSVKIAYNVGRYFRSMYKRTLTMKYSCNSTTSASNSTSLQYYNSGTVANTSQISTPSFKLASSGNGAATGYSVSKWNTASNGSGTNYSLGATYNSWRPAVTSTSLTMTLYCVTAINTVTIKYSVNGGEIKPSTTSTSNTTYAWTTEDDDIVRRNGSVLTTKINYGAKTESDGLNNYNNSKYIYIIYNTIDAIADKEWKCLSGCTTSGKTFDQDTVYSASDFCDASTKSCTVVVGVNWKTTINADRFSCEDTNSVAKYYTTTRSGSTLNYSKKNTLTSSFGSWTSSSDGDIKGTPTWKLDLANVSLHSTLTDVDKITSQNYTCTKVKLSVDSSNGLNCRKGPSTSTDVVTAYGDNTSHYVFRSTMKYSSSYRWYYHVSKGCYMAGQYVTTSSSSASSGSTGSSSTGSSCTYVEEISGSCKCYVGVMNGAKEVGCNSSRYNSSTCASYCNSNYAGGVASSSCSKQLVCK